MNIHKDTTVELQLEATEHEQGADSANGSHEDKVAKRTPTSLLNS